MSLILLSNTICISTINFVKLVCLHPFQLQYIKVLVQLIEIVIIAAQVVNLCALFACVSVLQTYF